LAALLFDVGIVGDPADACADVEVLAAVLDVTDAVADGDITLAGGRVTGARGNWNISIRVYRKRQSQKSHETNAGTPKSQHSAWAYFQGSNRHISGRVRSR